MFFRKTYENLLFRVLIGSLINPAALVRMGLAGNISDPTGHCQPLRFNSHMSF
jgi:hypothetical protein